MRFKVNRHVIEVVPESEEDEAYIEDTLGLLTDGDAVPLVRKNVIGMGCLCKLQTEWSSDRKLRVPIAKGGSEPGGFSLRLEDANKALAFACEAAVQKLDRGIALKGKSAEANDIRNALAHREKVFYG